MLLSRLEGLDSRFEEVSTLITDPAVIADQPRYVRLTKEYHDLEEILKVKKEYEQALVSLEESKELLSPENDENCTPRDRLLHKTHTTIGGTDQTASDSGRS